MDIVDDLAGEHVVGVVVVGIVGQDHIRLAVAHQIDEVDPHIHVFIKQLVVIIQTQIFRTDNGSALGSFLLAQGTDFLLGQCGGTDVAAGGGGDKDLVTHGGVFCQSTCAVDLDIIGMGADCKNIHTVSSLFACSIKLRPKSFPDCCARCTGSDGPAGRHLPVWQREPDRPCRPR